MQKLTTERLELRMPTTGDAQAIFSGYAQDPAVTKYLCWRPHKSLDETRTFVDRCLDGWARGDRACMGHHALGLRPRHRHGGVPPGWTQG